MTKADIILIALMLLAFTGLGIAIGHAIGHDAARQRYAPAACATDTIRTVPTTLPRPQYRGDTAEFLKRRTHP